MHLKKGLISLSTVMTVLAYMLSACVLPKTVANDSPDCKTATKKMTLEVLEYQGVYCYGHEDCLAVATVWLATTAVSGSVVIIGNSVHWLEEKARCSKPSEDKEPPDAGAPSKEVARNKLANGIGQAGRHQPQ